MNIPMVDLKTQYAQIKDELDKNLLTALEATQFILGPNVQAFEKEAAEYPAPHGQGHRPARLSKVVLGDLELEQGLWN